MTFTDLQRELRHKRGLMPVNMAQLRDAHGVGRLSQRLAGEISEELRRRNIGHHPAELPTSQNETVLLYELDHPFATVDRALESLGRDDRAVEILRRVRVAENTTGASEKSPQGTATVRYMANSDPLADVIRALHHAQFKKEFVGLKWFRDVELPAKNFSWAGIGFSYDELLRDAIARRIFNTKSIFNPNNPAHPTTAIEVNESSPEVRQALEKPAAPRGTFRPITPRRGGPLSAAILRDRR